MDFDHDAYGRLHRSLTNQTPDFDQIDRIEKIRDDAKNLGGTIISTAPPSRERSLALTHLEDAVMWAVKAIILENV